jgi:hypothetical protein
MEGNDDGEEDAVEHTLRRSMARYDMLERFAPALWIVALWIPLRAIYPIARVLAGRHTVVAVSISVSVALTLALGGGYVALVRRAKAQNLELGRMRKRCATLEGELKALES